MPRRNKHVSHGGTHGSRPTGCEGGTGRAESSAPTNVYQGSARMTLGPRLEPGKFPSPMTISSPWPISSRAFNNSGLRQGGIFFSMVLPFILLPTAGAFLAGAALGVAGVENSFLANGPHSSLPFKMKSVTAYCKTYAYAVRLIVPRRAVQ